MKKSQKILLTLALILVFVLVYSPHFDYRFPYHIDEWNHISNAKFLVNGDISAFGATVEFGFHIFLFVISKIFNLVLVYKFLPAIWAVFSAAVLFWVAYKKTSSNFFIALLSVIFFATIKSNVNVTGLWFFTPLTFSIPFIYLYIYFFTEGIEKQNKKLLLISIIIMSFLVPIHSISVLFALPFLLVYSLFYLNFLKKEYKFFSLLLLIPFLGILFYKKVYSVPWPELASNLINALQFKYGWGVLELQNLFTEIYSSMGYLLAVAGMVFIILFIKDRKKYIPYLFWPLMSLTLIILYRISGASYLIPYQRNLYYLVLSLPILSAFGFYYFIVLLNDQIKKLSLNENFKFYLEKFVGLIVILVVSFLIFKPYYQIPEQVDLYRVINEDDYQALLFLAELPQEGRVLATPFVSTAVYAVSNHLFISDIFFYKKYRLEVEEFFRSKDCTAKQKFIGKNFFLPPIYTDKQKIRYILSKKHIDCGWELIYQQNNYIYSVNNE
ncbi:MAG: hypothetical protein CMI53_02650 [Parcubacteria group bacterium]|nr:hypothetical protein [Parcubacteria group bacterium]|tara:strand:- start:2268 stop:3758 length:1491 start_codon:yes stop_codon:yes gene_type:complete